MHARIIKSEPKENWNLEMSSIESSAHESVVKRIPIHSLKLIFSLNIIRAIMAVVTISKLLSNEAFSAEIDFKPSNRKIGAPISSNIMAMMYGSSDFVNRDSACCVFFVFLSNAIIPIPSPAPIYKKPAMSVDGMKLSKILDNGEFIAYRLAAKIANKIPDVAVFFILFNLLMMGLTINFLLWLC